MTDSLKKSLKQAVKLVKKAKTICIFPHINADGDAIGSAFGIAFLLKDLNKQVKVYMEEYPGDKLNFLLDEEIDYTITDGEPVQAEKFDLAIVNDCSDKKRVGTRYEIVGKAKNILKIDHHVQLDNFGTVNFVDEKWSATCEGSFMLAQKLGYDFSKAKHGKKAAVSLYTGLLTDSGQFGYSNTRVYTHYVASELMKVTGDVSDIARNMFEMKTYAKVKIFGIAYQNAELFGGGKGIFTFVTEKDIENTAAEHQDTDGISSSLCSVLGVDVSVFVKPATDGSGKWKASLRSYKICDVAKVSAAFGGGGHVRAAGFEYEGTLEELKKKVKEEICLQIDY